MLCHHPLAPFVRSNGLRSLGTTTRTLSCRMEQQLRRCDNTVLHVGGVSLESSPVTAAQVRHVLCVKPNDELSPSYLDDAGLLRQLSAAGVVAAARVGMASLPAGRRVDKAAFFRDFRVIPGAIQRWVKVWNAHGCLGRSTTAAVSCSASGGFGALPQS